MATGSFGARTAVTAALVFAAFSFAARASGFSDSYRLYTIEGYLDHAPDGAAIIERIDIGATGAPSRELLVTAYRSPAAVLVDGYLSQELTYLLRGKREDVSRLLRAPQGAAFKGTFAVYRNAVPSLLIAELDRPA